MRYGVSRPEGAVKLTSQDELEPQPQRPDTRDAAQLDVDHIGTQTS